MAVYRGQINLININDGVDGEAIGILNTKVYYAVSQNGQIPPDFYSATLITNDEISTFAEKRAITSEEGILSFDEIGTTFHLKENILYILKNDELIPLTINSGIVSNLEGWSETIPEVPPGWYLWTKTVFTYTDNSSTIVYNVSRNGEDGKQGEPGKDGADASAYHLEANQPNILKFEQNEKVIVSPQILNLNVYKSNSSTELGQEQIKGLALDKLTIKIFSNIKGQWYELNSDIKQSIVTLNSLENSFNIKLDEYYKMQLEDDAQQTFIEEDCIFGFYYELNIQEENETKKYLLSTFLDCSFGMTKDIAKFSQNAADITASIQSTKLKFSANGLEVVNGGIQIKTEDNVPVFYADDNGNLIIKGILDACEGTFSGDISAASGNFSGTINGATGNFAGDISAATGIFKGGIQASEGLIGGFKIGPTSLVSTDNETNPAITLDGATGKIYAQNIELGTGAVIKEYIQLGSGKVTLNNSSKFLTVKNDNSAEILTISDEGVIAIGNGDDMIIIDGGKGVIKSQNYDNGLGWKISNTESIFNDVTVRGSIKASVLEYGEVQTVGGTLIVRPSSRIKNIEYDEDISKITLEDTTGFNIGDYCLINKDLNKIWVVITGIETNAITVNQKISADCIGQPLVDFGQKDKNGHGDVGIGINGSTNGALITPTSLSVFDFDVDRKVLVPHIILGKLPDDGYGFASGTYGLYAENVLLRGSLVTQTEPTENQASVYSGISTLYSGADSPTSHGYREWFGDTIGEILLWAGAASTDKSDVENSKFFVDKNGNMVAHSGYFKGTIITDATISASEIKTAIITGIGSDEYALTIKDAAKGIVFKSGNQSIFSLTEQSITAKIPEIILNDNFRIGRNGEVTASNLYMDGFKFNQGKILYSNNFNSEDLSGDFNTYIDFKDGISLSPNQSKKSLNITTTQIEINDTARYSGTVKYGINDNMKYEPVYENETLIGYDLYIN